MSCLRIVYFGKSIKNELIFSRSLTTQQKYYDSQSGSYINIPGKLGTRLHIVSCVNQENYVQSVLQNKKNQAISNHMSSVQLGDASNLQLFESGLDVAVPFDFNCAIPPGCVNKAMFEMNFQHLLSSENKNLNSERSMELESLDKSRANANKRFTDVSKLRIFGNLFLDVGKNISPCDVATTIGSLCDQDVEVINIVLCCRYNQENPAPLAYLTEDNADIPDYLSSVIEESLGLDVSGDPVIERLSVQCGSYTANLVAKELGLTRFTISITGWDSAYPNTIRTKDGKYTGSTMSYEVFSKTFII